MLHIHFVLINNQQPQRSAMSVTTLTSWERPHYNLRQTLLQFTYIYRCYKMLQPLLQTRRLDLLQNAAHVITQCAHYYKLLQSLLQNA